MLFSSISNLNMYAKNIKMTQQWHQKQREGKKTYAEQIQSAQHGVVSQMKAMQEAKAKRYSVEGLRNKLLMGKKLSGDEMEFLRENAPELYQKAVRVATERQDYERKLKNCKTKEDVRRLNMFTLGAHSSPGKSGGDSEESMMITNAINDEHNTFVATKAYKELPDDWKEERQLDRAERIKKKKKRNKNAQVLQLEKDRHLMPDFMMKAAEKEALKAQGKIPGVAENDKAGVKAEGVGADGLGGEAGKGGGEAATAAGPGTGAARGRTAEPVQAPAATAYTKTSTPTERRSTKGFTAKV